ncbi:MAG: YicC family protein [Bacteroidales bacterium]|nr:YicC family protein [Bacteroidales bacterium]
MLKSMTGYSKVSANFQDKTIDVEIKTLNSKAADIILKLPSNYKSQEISIKNLLQNGLLRGKIDCIITIQTNQTSLPLNINEEVFINYYKELEKLSKKVEANNEDLFSQALHLFEISDNEKVVPPLKEEILAVNNLISEAIENTNLFRSQEGEVLENDIVKRINIIKELSLQVEKNEPQRSSLIKERLKQKLMELKDASIDNNRLEQEMIYYIEKLDITEEKIRLAQHLDYFIETIKKEDFSGKKLGFIAQEINREINTLGSKAQNATIQQIVVQMKDELEKIKEQILNVL